MTALTKYNWEKVLNVDRSILDSISKVHFRNYYPLEFSYSPISDINNHVYIDLSKSNYFYLNLDLYPEDTNYANIFIIPINHTNNQRFEVLVSSGGSLSTSLLFMDESVYFIFPWGISNPPVSFSENFSSYSIISFRIGQITSTQKEYIGIQSEWIQIT